MGLSREEKAFYDALTQPQAVKDFYSNDQLVELTKELTEMLRRNRTIDWNRRESERANMRRLVKRMLKKYKYPPEQAENAMAIVLSQCEQWAEDSYESETDMKDFSTNGSRVIPLYPTVENDDVTAMAAEPVNEKYE